MTHSLLFSAQEFFDVWPVLMGEAQPYSGPRTPDGRVSHGVVGDRPCPHTPNLLAPTPGQEGVVPAQPGLGERGLGEGGGGWEQWLGAGWPLTTQEGRSSSESPQLLRSFRAGARTGLMRVVGLVAMAKVSSDGPVLLLPCS